MDIDRIATASLHGVEPLITRVAAEVVPDRDPQPSGPLTPVLNLRRRSTSPVSVWEPTASGTGWWVSDCEAP